MAAQGSTGRKLFAYFMFFMSFVFTISFLDFGSDWLTALFSALVTGGLGAWALRSIRRERDEHAGAEQVQRQLQVLRLAAETDGSLTVTEVAARLGWPIDVAQSTLRSLDDGVRVTSTLTEEGIFLYEFMELIHDPTRPQNRQAALPPQDSAERGGGRTRRR